MYLDGSMYLCQCLVGLTFLQVRYTWIVRNSKDWQINTLLGFLGLSNDVGIRNGLWCSEFHQGVGIGMVHLTFVL